MEAADVWPQYTVRHYTIKYNWGTEYLWINNEAIYEFSNANGRITFIIMDKLRNQSFRKESSPGKIIKNVLILVLIIVLLLYLKDAL